MRLFMPGVMKLQSQIQPILVTIRIHHPSGDVSRCGPTSSSLNHYSKCKSSTGAIFPSALFRLGYIT